MNLPKLELQVKVSTENKTQLARDRRRLVQGLVGIKGVQFASLFPSMSKHRQKANTNTH